MVRDTFLLAWKAWRQQEAPFPGYRSGHRSGPGYAVEADLDHVRTSVTGLVNGYFDGQEWNYEGRAQEELANLQLAELAIEALPSDVRARLEGWVTETRALLMEFRTELGVGKPK